MGKMVMILVVVALLVGGGYFLFARSTSAPDPYSMETQYNSTESIPYSAVLSEQNSSGESGMATLVEKNGYVEVTLDMTGAPAGVSQPAHIHTGTCAEIGGVAYPLTFPVDGKSVTTLNVTWAQLVAQKPLALNVHKSATEASVYVSCGDLPL